MRIVLGLLYILMYSTSWNALAQPRKAFVNPQSECRIKCLNGGFCAYLVDNPSVHTCLCLLNVYYGDRCQYAVVETTQTTSVSTVKRLLPSRSGLERSETEHRLPTLSIESVEKTFDEHEMSSSKDDNTKMYQIKQPKRITTTEEAKTLEENDYTEGWDTIIDNDSNDNMDQYMYDDNDDDQTTDLLDNGKTDSSMPLWLQESDDYRVITSGRSPQRIYLNKKKADQLVMHVDKDNKQLMTAKDQKAILKQWTNSNDHFGSEEAITKSEFETDFETADDGWMISKRRRVITNGADANVITNKLLLQLAFFLISVLVTLLR